MQKNLFENFKVAYSTAFFAYILIFLKKLHYCGLLMVTFLMQKR